MTKIQQLISLCKCGITIEINAHRDYYMTAEQCLDEIDGEEGMWQSETDPKVWRQMIETDTIISIQAYPNTPVSFHRIYHYDVDAAIDRMIELLNSEYE